MTTPSLAYAAKLLCSFCGKDHKEVRKLIAGPTVFICDECVRLCQEILDEPIANPAPVFTPAQEARIREIIGQISAADLKQDVLDVSAKCANAASAIGFGGR